MPEREDIVCQVDPDLLQARDWAKPGLTQDERTR
jgi:hypothetical protein